MHLLERSHALQITDRQLTALNEQIKNEFKNFPYDFTHDDFEEEHGVWSLKAESITRVCEAYRISLEEYNTATDAKIDTLKQEISRLTENLKHLPKKDKGERSAVTAKITDYKKEQGTNNSATRGAELIRLIKELEIEFEMLKSLVESRKRTVETKEAAEKEMAALQETILNISDIQQALDGLAARLESLKIGPEKVQVEQIRRPLTARQTHRINIRIPIAFRVALTLLAIGGPASLLLMKKSSGNTAPGNEYPPYPLPSPAGILSPEETMQQMSTIKTNIVNDAIDEALEELKDNGNFTHLTTNIHRHIQSKPVFHDARIEIKPVLDNEGGTFIMVSVKSPGGFALFKTIEDKKIRTASDTWLNEYIRSSPHWTEIKHIINGKTKNDAFSGIGRMSPSEMVQFNTEINAGQLTSQIVQAMLPLQAICSSHGIQLTPQVQIETNPITQEVFVVFSYTISGYPVPRSLRVKTSNEGF